MVMVGRLIAGWLRRRKQTRPWSPSTHEKLGNWTDGRISCQHSAPTYFLVQLYKTLRGFGLPRDDDCRSRILSAPS